MHNLLLEIWQTEANGILIEPQDRRWRVADPDFIGWGRAATDSAGCYRFQTIRPGRYAAFDGSLRTPHIFDD